MATKRAFSSGSGITISIALALRPMDFSGGVPNRSRNGLL
jgi:hypothetical protein